MRTISERGNTRVSRGNMGYGSKRLRGCSLIDRSCAWTGLDIKPGPFGWLRRVEELGLGSVRQVHMTALILEN